VKLEDGWPCEGGVGRELIGPIRLIGPIGESAETEMTSAAADAENTDFRLPHS
jgi:hypothetical protein